MQLLTKNQCLSAVFTAFLAFSHISTHADEHIIAAVGNNAVLASELDDMVNQQAARLQAIGQALPPNFKDMVLKQMLLRHIQLQLAKKNGVQIDDKAVQAELENLAKQNKLDSVDALKSKLNAESKNAFDNLKADIVENLKIEEYRQYIIRKRIKVTEKDIDDFVANPNNFPNLGQRYHVVSFMLPTDGKSNKELKESTLLMRSLAKEFAIASSYADWLSTKNERGIALKGGDLGWQTDKSLPSEIATRIVNLNKGEVTEPISTPEGLYVFKLEDKADSKKNIIKQRKVRHILIKAAKNDDAAEVKIENIYKKIQHGEDFASLAATYSEDPGSAKRGGDLEWISPGEMVGAFEKMVYATPIGDFSTPFKSEFGWHILKIEDERMYDATKDLQRQFAEKTLFEHRYNQELQDWLTEIYAKAYIKHYE